MGRTRYRQFVRRNANLLRDVHGIYMPVALGWLIGVAAIYAPRHLAALSAVLVAIWLVRRWRRQCRIPRPIIWR